VVAAAAVITANACGSIKQISATANRTTDTTDTFTAPTASYAGCCMDVVNVDTVDTITLDNNANFITGPGTDLTLGPGKAVRVCSDGTSWYQAASVTNVASGGNIPLSGLTAAIADNSINNGNWNQVWNWQLAAGEVGFTFGENTASAGGTADQYILAAKTLATSTATPFMITNLGAADSFRVNDETGDADTTPFIIKADGKVGIGTDSPDELLTMASDAEIGMSIQVSTSGNANWNPYFETNRSRGTVAAPTAVQSGDMLMDFVVRGHDGTAHRVGAMITAVVDGTPGANDMPTRLEFQTQADGAGGWLGDGGSTPEMVIKNTGNIGISKAAPAGRLHVVGAGDGGASPTLIVDNALATQESFIGLGSNGTLKWLIGMEDNDDGTTGANDFAIFDYDALTWRFVINKATGAVGIGNTSPASRFVVGSPTAEVIGAAATITANSCGTVKQISATANRTTDTTDTFTAPTASYNGCCMDVVNVDTVDTITLDQNAKFFTGPGTDLALGPGKAVRVCSDGTSWYQAASVTSVASGGNIPLSGLTAAIAANSINNADYAQTWNWQLTTNDKDAFTFTENTASTATGHSSILKAATLATSTATPLIVTNLGAGDSFVVNDETGDADASPFIVKADGKVGIGTASPGVKLDINNDNTIMSAIKTGDALRVGAYGTTDNFLSMGPLRVGADVGSAIQAADVVAGTGQSLLLNPFGGNVGIGTTTPSQLLEVYGTNAYISLLSNGEGAVTSTAASANWWDNGGFNAARSRGTIAAPTAVQSGDSVLTMWGTAYDGDTWETPALMQYFVDGTPGDGDMPGRIEFQTQADGAAVNPEATTPELVIKNSGNIGVSIAAPSAKLHVSNADAADSFRVDDVAGDTSPFVIAADGNVGIGIANPDELLDIGADAEKGLSVQVSTSGDPNWNPYIQTKRSRGTMASPTAVQNGDMLLDFIISGHDGSNFRTAAMIEAVVDGAVTGGGAADMPTRLEFQVQADGAGGWLGDGASTPEMVIKSNGAVGIGTATPNAGAKLDVAGPIFLDGLNDGSTGDLFFGGGGWPYSIGVGWAGQDNTLRFNAVGTSGGTADFRNVMILDGKTNPFAFFQGSTKRLATGGDDSTPDAMLEVIKDSTSPLFMLSSAAANNGDLMIVDTNGNVGIGLTSPASKFVVASPTAEVIGAAATITANSCGTVKQISATADRTTDTTDTFTAPTASYAGCCMDVVNVDTVDTITLDSNAKFFTGPGTDVALGPGKGVRVCSDGTSWYQAGGVSSATSASNALSGITAATTDATIASGANNITWNWQLAGAEVGHTFGETAASAGGSADQYILAAKTLATSTATPFMITNLGAAASFRVNDETGDADASPFVIAADGKVGIGMTAPATALGVTGSITVTSGQLYVPAGTLTDLPITIGGDTDSGFYSPSDGVTYLVSNGTALYQFQADKFKINSATVQIQPGFGSAAAPTYAFDSDADLGWYRAAADEIGISTAGTEKIRVDASGDVGIGNTSPASRFVVSPPSSEVIAAAAVITGDACGTVKQISATANRTTNTTDTFTTPTASYNGCCMDVVNVDTVDTITLDQNARFFTGPGTDIALAPGQGVRVCSDGTSWYQAGGVSSATAGGGGTIDGLSDAYTDYTTLNNIIMGRASAAALTAGAQYNLFIGENAGATSANSTATTDLNVAVGHYALPALTSGSYNTALGALTLQANTTGFDNVAIGTLALNTNVTKGQTTAVGYRAMEFANSAAGGGITYNTAIGALALQGSAAAASNTGTENTALGHSTLMANTSGSDNVAIGKEALKANTTASDNTAIGESAMLANTTGAMNTAMGSNALYQNIGGSANVAVGDIALGSTTASGNTAVGFEAGYAGTANTSGTYNTFIGHQAQANANNYTNATALGNGAIVTASNMMMFGNSSVTTNVFNGNVGIGTATPATNLHVASNAETFLFVDSAATNQWLNPTILGRRSRGTLASPTIVADDDELFAIGSYAYDGNSYEVGGYIGFYTDGTPGNADMPTRITLFTAPDGSATSLPRMTVNNAGNVGIGTSDPTAPLHIKKATDDWSTALRVEGDGEPTFAIDTSSAFDYYNPLIMTSRSRGSRAAKTAVASGDSLFEISTSGYDGSNDRVAFYMAAVVDGTVTGGGAADMPTRLEFHVQADGAGGGLEGTTPDMVIKNNGNVGIAMASPSVKLDVTGDIEYTGTIADVSDIRLKKDIHPLSERGSMLHKLGLIDTYSFKMKDSEVDQVEFGVMAQEIEKIFPELVRTADDEMGTKSVNYTGLIAPMIEAGKELEAQNKAMKAEIEALKARQDEMKQAMNEITEDMKGLKVHTGYGIGKAEMSLLMILAALGTLGAAGLARRRFSKPRQ
ncbi:MAG: tail fiber domain-containing protein, partial [Micavibrio sp.]|nr:tail fiber domain-containing protein [Micavibrio sp.]